MRPYWTQPDIWGKLRRPQACGNRTMQAKEQNYGQNSGYLYQPEERYGQKGR